MKIEKLKGVYIKVAEKNLKARIVHKHDTEANWLLATGFTPKQGEIIVYDIDDDYSYERIKIGDGVQNVNDLPFADDALREALTAQINDVDDKVDAVSTLVGDTSVATQINEALANSQADWDVSDETSYSYIKNKPEIATDDEIIDMIAQEDMLPVVADSDGSLLADENNNILLW